MVIDLAFATKVFAALFAIMNPIANVPIFLSLTDGSSAASRRAVAVTASIGVAAGCAISVLAGGAILKGFGLSVDDFRLAGGLLVLLIAIDMLQGHASTQHSPTPQEHAQVAEHAEQAATTGENDVAIYPLTIPLLVGPGTIATLIVFGQSAVAEGKEISLAIGLVAFLVLLTAALLSAPSLGRFLSPRVTAITKRLMGMILAAIAMQMIIASLQVFFPALDTHPAAASVAKPPAATSP